MLDGLKSFLFDRETASVAEAAKEQDKLHIAAAALLLEAAQLDGSLDTLEKDRVRHIVQKRFDLSSEDTAAIMDNAEQKAKTNDPVR